MRFVSVKQRTWFIIYQQKDSITDALASSWSALGPGQTAPVAKLLRIVTTSSYLQRDAEHQEATSRSKTWGAEGP